MSAIPVNLPDDLRARAEARAAAAGRAGVADYIRALVEEDVAGELLDGPAHLSPRTAAQADALVREGLDSPTREMTDADWAAIRKAVEEGIDKQSGGGRQG
jgi:plasmid stability protein